MFRELSIVNSLPKLIVQRRSRLRWEQHVQSMVGVIQCTAKQAFICLFHQLNNVWHIRWTEDLLNPG